MVIFYQIVYKEDLRKTHLSGTGIPVTQMVNEEISSSILVEEI